MANINISIFCYLISLICLLNNCVTAQRFSSNVASCGSTCQSTFQGYEACVCNRGCRLMSLLAFIHGPMMTMEELGQACRKTCGEAYLTTNASACAFGCQSQLPTVEERRNNMMQLSNLESDPMFEMTRRFMDYSNRIMNSLMSGLNDGVSRVGWISVSSYSSDDGGKVVVVVDGPRQIQLQPHKKMLGGSDVKFEVREVGRLPEDARKQQQVLVDGVESSEEEAVSYFMGKSHLRPIVFFLFLLVLAVLMWYILNVCLEASDRRVKNNELQKLSIYGDLDYLPMYDDGQPTFLKNKNLGYEAPPLPLKTQKI